jgi:hypothetical protein
MTQSFNLLSVVAALTLALSAQTAGNLASSSQEGQSSRKAPKMRSGDSPTQREAEDQALIKEYLDAGMSMQEVLLLFKLDKHGLDFYENNKEVFKPGEEAFLIAPSTLLSVFVYMSQAAFQESVANWNEKSFESFRAADSELDRLGKRLLVRHGTKVQVLDTASAQVKGKSFPLLKVKLLESREAGKIVWVEKDDVRHGLIDSNNQ